MANNTESNGASFIAFCSARKEYPPWHKALPESFYYMLRVFCKSIMTPFQCGISCVFGAVAVLATRTTVIVITPRWKMKPNVFLLCVSHMGFGKTQGFNELFGDPIKAVVKRTKNEFLQMDVTYAGMLTFLEANQMRCTLAGDELVPFLAKMYLSRTDEFHGFRAVANTCFGGGTYTKKMGSKTYKISDPILSMFGITQPEPCVNFFKGVAKLKDGSMDRWMVITAGLEEPDSEPNHISKMITEVVDVESVEDDFCKLYVAMLLNITDMLERNPENQFTLDDEASKIIVDRATAFREDAQQATELVDEFLAKCRNSTLEAEDERPVEPVISKCTDYIVKFSWIISLIRKCFGKTKAQLKHDAAFWVISKDDVEQASEIVDMLDKQRKIYLECGGTLQEQVRDKDKELALRILKLKGKCFTSVIVARNNLMRQWLNQNRMGSSDVTRVFKKLDGERAEGQSQFIGRYVHDRHHIFYKGHYSKVDGDYMKEMYGVTRLQYLDAYCDDEAGTDKPISGLRSVLNSKELTKKLMQSCPFDESGASTSNRHNSDDDDVGSQARTMISRLTKAKEELNTRKRKLTDMIAEGGASSTNNDESVVKQGKEVEKSKEGQK